jgi:hypothetical protein
MNTTTKLAGLTLAMGIAGSAAFAQANLTAETASPGGSIHLSLAHLTEVASQRGIANIQLADGQTLTNSVQNVAEGKTDIAGTPYILPFLLAKGRGPYSKLGEDGAALADNLRALYPVTLGIFTLYAYDSSPVKGWDTIADNSILNGPPRGAAVTNARAVIQLATGLKEGELGPGDQDHDGWVCGWCCFAGLVPRQPRHTGRVCGQDDHVVDPDCAVGIRRVSEIPEGPRLCPVCHPDGRRHSARGRDRCF